MLMTMKIMLANVKYNSTARIGKDSKPCSLFMQKRAVPTAFLCKLRSS